MYWERGKQSKQCLAILGASLRNACVPSADCRGELKVEMNWERSLFLARVLAIHLLYGHLQ